MARLPILVSHLGFSLLTPHLRHSCAGNEGDVTLYVNHTGLMWEAAPDFGALLVFAEHRYYGESLPFPGQGALQLQYLTHEQARVDRGVALTRS